MSDQISAIHRVVTQNLNWPSEGLQIVPLPLGLTNDNFIVSSEDRKVVVRISDPDPVSLGINRDLEFQAMNQSADLGIGPRPVFSSSTYSITEFVTGVNVDEQMIKDPLVLAKVVSSVRVLHRSSELAGRFDVRLLIAEHLKRSKDLGSRRTVAFERASSEAARLYPVIEKDSQVPCHNDLNRSNILISGQKCNLLDWEYAGMGSAFFDLGKLAAHFNFNEQEIDRLLQLYSTVTNDEQRYKIRVGSALASLWHASWHCLQSVRSPRDFDFWSRAEIRLQQFYLALAQLK